MDRNVLLYLKDLRALEVARWKLGHMLDNEERNYGQHITNLNQTNFVQQDSKAGWTISKIIGMLLCFGLGLWVVVYFIQKIRFGTVETGGWQQVDPPEDHPTRIVIRHVEKTVPVREEPLAKGLCIFMVVIGVILILIGLYLLYRAIRGTRSIKSAKLYNAQESLRVEKNKGTALQVKTQWIQRKNYLEDEKKKVESLLSSHYNLNIIPREHRGLASIYYIYDYMSSSQETLTDTLLHDQIDKSVQKILAKLDYIIGQNEEIILQNRMIEAHSKTTTEQNKKMLKTFSQIETNTAAAAQYAELSSNYSKASAYFNLANY